MEGTEEKGRGFKVDDRRRFSAEGEPKPEQEGGEAPGPQTSPEQPRQKVQSAAGEKAPPPPEINFAAFVVSLSTQALLHLGEIADPSTNQAQPDLAGAQQIIDILGVLKEKTRGNLDRNEEGLLDSILFDLRMKYVEIARQTGR